MDSSSMESKSRDLGSIKHYIFAPSQLNGKVQVDGRCWGAIDNWMDVYTYYRTSFAPACYVDSRYFNENSSWRIRYLHTSLWGVLLISLFALTDLCTKFVILSARYLPTFCTGNHYWRRYDAWSERISVFGGKLPARDLFTGRIDRNESNARKLMIKAAEYLQHTATCWRDYDISPSPYPRIRRVWPCQYTMSFGFDTIRRFPTAHAMLRRYQEMILGHTSATYFNSN